MIHLNVKGALLVGGLAAIGASLCCVAPLALLMLGVGGAWIANLTALEPYSPIFIGLTLLFLGLAFRKLYLAAPICAEGVACANPRVLKRQRLTFWFVATPALGLLATPWLAPLFY
ncbi:mercuric transporter MerT family protein [Methylocapsa polymorpha]|uniref:Mercuric transport protein MerT n=1 Tax=Methylocapsa polymorpha TaxID=3080828 RepID=A0ABZ0HN67_9HYPH|nr:mercuric transporter MerT family protein [Methylocapsa sp. RX1]